MRADGTGCEYAFFAYGSRIGHYPCCKDKGHEGEHKHLDELDPPPPHYPKDWKPREFPERTAWMSPEERAVKTTGIEMVEHERDEWKAEAERQRKRGGELLAGVVDAQKVTRQAIQRAEAAESQLAAAVEVAHALRRSIVLVNDAAYWDRDDHRYGEFRSKQSALLDSSARSLADLDAAAREHDDRVRVAGRKEAEAWHEGQGRIAGIGAAFDALGVASVQSSEDEILADLKAHVAAVRRAGWDAAIEAAAERIRALPYVPDGSKQ